MLAGVSRRQAAGGSRGRRRARVGVELVDGVSRARCRSSPTARRASSRAGARSPRGSSCSAPDRAAQDGVARVRGMPFDQDLRRKDAPAVLAHRHVDVRGAKNTHERVLDRLDGAEVVLALGVGEEPAVALEVLVVRPALCRPCGCTRRWSTCQISTNALRTGCPGVEDLPRGG